jgi:hypothetical protein
LDHPHAPTELLDILHGFKQYLNFKMAGGWLPDDSKVKSPLVTTSIDNEKDAKKQYLRQLRISGGK